MDSDQSSFRTELHGEKIKITNESNGLISIYDMQWLADRLLSGKRITQAEQRAAGAAVKHLTLTEWAKSNS